MGLLITLTHAFLAFMLIIELGFTGYLVSHDGTYSTKYGFMLFNSLWTILVLIYIALVPMVLASLVIAVATFGLLALTAIFWFCGSIALAAHVGVPSCSSSYCNVAQAAVAFGFFIWAVVTALAVMEGLSYLKSRGPGATADGRSAKTRPSNGV